MKRSLIACLACSAFLFVGCAEKSRSASSVRIAPTIATRVTGLHFDTGDHIGLTITKTSGLFVENRKMEYDGTAFTSNGLLWYNDLSETSTLTAYHPYSEAGVPDLFSVATDQKTGTASSDLLAAVKSGVTPVSAPVGMLFHHVMSQLSILITNNSEAAVSGVTLSGLVPLAKVDFTVPSAAVSEAAAADIEAFEVTPDKTFRAIVVPQTAALTVTVYTEDGKSRSRTISAAQFVSGMRYDLAVEVNNIDIDLKLSGDIDDWQDGGSLEGGSQGGGDTGKVNTLTYEGETYSTTTIDGRVWMAENLRYVPENAVLENGIWYPAGGAQSVAEQGMLYDYQTAAGSVVRAGSVQGICPLGWHIPDRTELTSLIESEGRGAEFFCCGGYWIAANETYGVANKGYLLGAELNAQGQCSCLMYTTLAGGQPSIVQFSSENGVSVRCVKDAQ